MRVRSARMEICAPTQVVVGGEVEDYQIKLSAGSPPRIADDQFAWYEDAAASDLNGLPIIGGRNTR